MGISVNKMLTRPGQLALLFVVLLLTGGVEALAQGKVLILPQPPPPGTQRYPHTCVFEQTVLGEPLSFEFRCWDWDITPTESPGPPVIIHEGDQASFSLGVAVVNPDSTFILDAGLGGGTIRFRPLVPTGEAFPASVTWNVRDDVKVDSGSATFTFLQDVSLGEVVAQGRIGACSLNCALGLEPKPTGEVILGMPYNVTVLNVPPTLGLAQQALMVEEGESLLLSGSFSDPGILDPHTATIDWGDGALRSASVSSVLVNGNLIEGTASGRHVYPDDGVFEASLCVRDDDQEVCETATVTVTNALPELQPAGPSLVTLAAPNPGVEVHASLSLDRAFLDRGLRDTHTATIDWGDGSPVEPLNAFRYPPGSPKAGIGTVSGTHLYAGSGQYQAQICVTDDDGGTGCRVYPVDVPLADLSMDLADDEDAAGVIAGTELTYVMNLGNAGPDSAGNISLTGFLPAGVTPLYAFPGGDSLNPVPAATELVPFDFDVPGGSTLAISGDEAAVGSYPGTAAAPAVAFFTRTQAGWSATPDQVITSPFGLANPLSSATDYFGAAVAVSGNVAAVGAPGVSPSGVDEGGLVYIYRKGESGWVEETSLRGSDTRPGEIFGHRLVISGNTLAVASLANNGPTLNRGAVYLFEENGTGWVQTAKLTSGMFDSFSIFGLRMGLDGDTLVTSPGVSSLSRALVYQRGSSGWSLVAQLSPFAGTGSQFSESLAIDGDTILAGGFDRAYVYKYDGTAWTPQDSFAVDINVGNQTAAGAAALAGDLAVLGTRGAFKLFQRRGTVWVESTTVPIGAGNGSELVFALDRETRGSRLLVGEPRRGPGGGTDIFEWCPEVAPGVIHCDVGTLAGGDQATVTAVTRVGCFDEGTVITSSASVAAGASDPAAGDNFDAEEATTRILGSCEDFGTPPFITPAITGTEGDRGWYVSDVTLQWDVIDPESQVLSSSGCGESMVTGDTGGETFSCTATSLGGQATNSVTIRRDTVPPEIMASLVSLDAAGAVVEFTCQDDLSGVARCPGQVALPLEATAQTATGTATDRAGNSASTSLRIRGNLPPIANGGGNLEVGADATCNATVELDARLSVDPDGDPLAYRWSGPFGTASGAQPQVQFPLGASVTTLEIDDGLGGADSDTVGIQVSDRTAPVFTNVIPQITAECAGPGLTSVSVPQPLVTDNCTPGLLADPVDQEYPAGITILQWIVSDDSGNTSAAETRVEIQDTVPPVVVAPPDQVVDCVDPAGTAVPLGQPQVDDACGRLELTDDAPDLFPPGVTVVTWTATDSGGNVGTDTAVVEIIPAGEEICDGEDNDCDGLVDEAHLFQGYQPPVKSDGSSIFRHGRTIPFRFQILDCGGQIIAGSAPTIDVLPYADGVVGTVLEEIASPGQANEGNLYRFDSEDEAYVYNLDSGSLEPAKSYLVVTTLEDGSTHEVVISIK